MSLWAPSTPVDAHILIDIRCVYFERNGLILPAGYWLWMREFLTIYLPFGGAVLYIRASLSVFNVIMGDSYI